VSEQEGNGPGEDPAELRAELARVREEAGQALVQLRWELDALRVSRDSMRDVDSVAEQLALQQELDTIRRTLQEKERLVDATAAQCRRLEDELEDQHLAYDGLKQDLDRKKLSLVAAREQSERVSRERHEIDGRYRSLLNLEQSATFGKNKADRPRNRRPVARLTAGLAFGVALAVAAVAAWVLLDPLAVQDSEIWGEHIGESPVSTIPQTAPEDSIGTLDAGTAPAEEAARPVVLGTVRDRLSDGSTGPPMVALQGGELTMGKPQALPGDDAGPSHLVRLNGFLIGATEVTFEEYDRFVRATGHRSPSDFGWGRGRRPVVDVSWQDARAYAQWLSRRTGKRYRLPSEAEWEFAAAAGTRSFFWWGHRAGEARAACFDCGSAWDNRSSAPVGSFDPNPLGLHDTAGNVMEWVEDCYQPNYVGAPLNGQPRGGGSCGLRVARGGAFNKPSRSMRSVTRHRFAPETRINYLGFRLARDE
jgi:formylglycine-generating enzyme required for sulfatase activity